VEETETMFALRAEIAELKAQNAELTRALSEAERKHDRLRQILEPVPGVGWELEGAELLERLKGLKARVDRVTASVPGMLWEVRGRAGTPEHRFTFVSDYANTMIGYLPEEITGDKDFWRHVTHPEDQEQSAREIRAVYEKGTGSVQYRWFAKDGRVVWVESTFHVIRDEEGMPVSAYGITIDVTDRKLADEERARLKDEVIRAQAAALEELSTPLIPISADILVMPLIGAVDRVRAERVIETLLQGISRARARFALIEITGVASVDTQTADTLLRAARAVRLLGAEVVLTGIRPEVAQTLVALGTNLEGIATCGSLESGIAYATRRRSELVT
jgi:rsbT co-antagonist protein RsbR